MDWSDLEEAYKKLNAIWPDRKKHDHLRKGPKSPGFTQEEQREHERIFMNARPLDLTVWGIEDFFNAQRNTNTPKNNPLNWHYVEAEQRFWNVTENDEIECAELIRMAYDYCKRNFEDDDFKLLQNNDFIFRNAHDAAAFAWGFVEIYAKKEPPEYLR